MSSAALSRWSATEPMTLSLTCPMADTSPNTKKRVPSAAQRYYTQPRIGRYFGLVHSTANGSRFSRIGKDAMVRESRLVEEECEEENEGNGEGRPKKLWAMRKPARSNSCPSRSSIRNTPIRHSPRLIKKRAAALETMLRERFFGNFSPAPIRFRTTSRRLDIDPRSEDLPALSEDPAIYHSNSEDCRFHIPSTTEDRLAIRAALTPTLFRLQKKGWRGSVVWNPDASYMEAHQKCLGEYYSSELTKDPNLSPFDLCTVLTLLPWYGKISNFRNSPNWPKGW